jgi:predicted amidohydrolase
MKISLLQPHIQRGEIAYNRVQIQSLIEQAEGELLVLPEYALTGSLTLETTPNPRAWAESCAREKAQFAIPPGKSLLLNSLVLFEDGLRNCCELLPGGESYCKLFPDETEQKAGILPGKQPKVFSLGDKRFSVLICFDLPHIAHIPTDGLDFLLFIYHFTPRNLERVLSEARDVARSRCLPVLVSSLVSDQNNGKSAFIRKNLTLLLGEKAGIMEVEIT